MMPDLGKYAEAVIGSYAVSLLLIALLVGWSLWRGQHVRAELAKVEARANQRRADAGENA